MGNSKDRQAMDSAIDQAHAEIVWYQKRLRELKRARIRANSLADDALAALKDPNGEALYEEIRGEYSKLLDSVGLFRRSQPEDF